MLNWGNEKFKWPFWNGMPGHFRPESAGQITPEPVAKLNGICIARQRDSCRHDSFYFEHRRGRREFLKYLHGV